MLHPPMTTSYARALATPGAPRFVAAAFVGRLPIAMVSLGTILLVRQRTGSYGLAGAVAATGAIAEACCAPMIGRALDRLGQERVLLVCLLGHVGALAGLVAAVRTPTARPVWFGCAAVCGGCLPPIGACVRSRWSTQLGDGPLLASAFALESAVDELIFVLGPSAVTVLGTLVSPVAGLAASGAASVAGTLTLASQRATDPGPRRRARSPGDGMLRMPATRLLVVTFLATGTAFGGLDVSMLAFGRAHGLAALSGVMLGLVAAASGTSGLVFGARPRRTPPERTFVGTAACMAIGMCLPIAAPGVGAMVPLAVGAGLAVAPMLSTGYALVGKLMPAEARTEGFTWLTTAIMTGAAVGSPLAGHAIDVAGPRAGFVVVAIAGLLAASITVAGRRTLTASGPLCSACDA
jgi:MFS family permease